MPGVDLPADIRQGLPLESESIDYAVTIHALQELPYDQVPLVLNELRRVLKPGGILRLALPDIDRGIRAYERGDRDYFLVPDEEAKSVGAKFILQTIWYGFTRTPFNHDLIEELLLKAGFTRMDRCAYRQTQSRFAEIVALDNRERESLFVEAVK